MNIKIFHRIKSKKIKAFGWNKLLLLLLLPLLSFSLHKEYYSLTKIDYNQKEETVQITMKLFTNDMELVLNKHFNKVLELDTQIEIAEADHLLETYLKQKFTIAIDDVQLNYSFIGKEFEKDALFVYLEIKKIKQIHQIEIQAAMLIEEFPEQENIIKVNINEQRKSLFLTNRNDKALLKF
ncbi:MAG TPA: hypothetical protein EYG92_12100 [Lutibacter sp.]|nr:hypothetical protein [Lutibacter sp.]